MVIYNEDLTRELDKSEIDLIKGRIEHRRIFVAHHEAIEPVEEVSHIEVVTRPSGKTYERKVIDIPAVEGKEAWDEYKTVRVYKPYTEAELKERMIAKLRSQRKAECFPIVNRGAPWYERLTAEQREELEAWYAAWLNVTETLEAPEMPAWLK